MATLRILVEGKTELEFVEAVLRPHLASHQVQAWGIDLGGHLTYARVRKTILHTIKQVETRDDYVTTMFDLFRLNVNFPGYGDYSKIRQSGNADPLAKVTSLEAAFRADIGSPQFIPHIQLHEFETLLFCDPQRLGKHYPELIKEVGELVAIANAAITPEHINDGDATAPSKRLESKLPGYAKSKALVGPQAAADIGLQTILGKCPHFKAWIERLESLGPKGEGV